MASRLANSCGLRSMPSLFRRVRPSSCRYGSLIDSRYPQSGDCRPCLDGPPNVSLDPPFEFRCVDFTASIGIEDTSILCQLTQSFHPVRGTRLEDGLGSP